MTCSHSHHCRFATLSLPPCTSSPPPPPQIEKDRITRLAKEHWATRHLDDAQRRQQQQQQQDGGGGDGGGEKPKPLPPFDPAIVERLYATELGGSGVGGGAVGGGGGDGGDGGADANAAQRRGAPSRQRAMLLELSQYLENYLWPHFDAASSSDAHVLSIVAMVNQKQREGVPAWACFHTREVRRRVLRCLEGMLLLLE